MWPLFFARALRDRLNGMPGEVQKKGTIRIFLLNRVALEHEVVI